jgi:hypothetical protein
VTNERKCEYCSSDKTYIAVTKNGTSIQNGIKTRSKKIVGYVEDVIDTFCTERLYLQFMFAEAFV